MVQNLRLNALYYLPAPEFFFYLIAIDVAQSQSYIYILHLCRVLTASSQYRFDLLASIWNKSACSPSIRAPSSMKTQGDG